MTHAEETLVDTLRKLSVDVVGVTTERGTHRFSVSNETDARHAAKLMRACRAPRVKVLAPTSTQAAWTVTMGADRD